MSVNFSEGLPHIENCSDKTVWFRLSANPNLTKEFIEKNISKLKMSILVGNPAMSLEMIEKYDSCWTEASNNPNMTFEFLEKHISKFRIVYKLPKDTPLEFIEKHFSKIYPTCISGMNLNCKFYEEHFVDLDLEEMALKSNMEVIDHFLEYLDFDLVSQNPNLTPEFILKCKNRLAK